jgi:hypothetical protein
MVCFRYVIVYTLHKGDNKDNNTNNNHNNNCDLFFDLGRGMWSVGTCISEGLARGCER